MRKAARPATRRLLGIFAGLTLIALSPAPAYAASHDIPGGTYKGSMPLKEAKGSMKVSFEVSHSIVSNLKIGATTAVCDTSFGNRSDMSVKIPPLSGFPPLKLKKTKFFNPGDMPVGEKFVQAPLNATASNPWKLWGPEDLEDDNAVVIFSGSFIVGQFQGGLPPFEVIVNASSAGVLGAPGPDGVPHLCTATAEGFTLTRASGHKKKPKKKHH